MKIGNWELGIGNWELLLLPSSFDQLPTANCQLLTANCQLSTVNCQLSTDYGIRQILIVRSGLPLTKVLLSLATATEFTNWP
ncbi:MAG: hypothetical protein JGK23_33900 [Microcoleus sp. PH2017_19_SFW_U_A]|nr:hypothetical protein [Microcoleus sp. PH2017_19_SFW_U_A]